MMPEGFWPDELSVNQVEVERLRRDKRNARNQAIEECAKVADEYAAVAKRSNAPIQLMIAGERIAAFIRALKDKPNDVR